MGPTYYSMGYCGQMGMFDGKIMEIYGNPNSLTGSSPLLVLEINCLLNGKSQSQICQMLNETIIGSTLEWEKTCGNHRPIIQRRSIRDVPVMLDCYIIFLKKLTGGDRRPPKKGLGHLGSRLLNPGIGDK